MPNLKTYLYLGLALASVSSCTSSYYATTPNTAPMLREVNEGTASVGRSLYNYSRSTDLSLAFSPMEHFALLGNFSWMETSYGQISRDQFGMKGSFFEGALGYYDSWTDNFGYDIYAGFGQLNQGESFVYDFYYNYNQDVVRFNYNRIFFQPAMAYTSDFFDAQLAIRASQVNYNQVLIDSLSPEDYIDFPPSAGDGFFLLEPGLTLRGGYRYLKAQVHIGSSFNLSGQPLPRDYFNLSFGLVFNFKPSYKNKGKPQFKW